MSVTDTPMGDLVEDMRQIWEQSVDELDASVSLEADGVNDTVAANRFGVRDIADLAEQLTMLVPARVPAETPDDLGKPIPYLSLIHISEPTRRTPISYAVFCLKKKKQ